MARKAGSVLTGDGLKARALRGSALTMISFGGSNVLRLASNLILTRLLFPEAFGLMALVQVFVSGLQMFSDLGIRASIIQNDRGEEPAFLNTAWTVQILRGIVLWLAACALAYPVANFYEEPMLAQLLPIVGLNALIAGFMTTNAATANRNLMLGRLTVVELVSQTIGIVAMIVLAYLYQSVWALVAGSLVGSLSKVAMLNTWLPGIRNRLAWDTSAFHDLFSFGKYIFLSTVAGFLISHGDRAILGKYVSLSELAVYSIAFFLATVPQLLCRKLVDQVIFPLYRNKRPSESAANRAKINRARMLLTGGMFALSLAFAVSGIWLIEVMYDPRYALAGPILVLLALSRLPTIMTNSYGSVLLAQGASGSFAILMVIGAVLRTIAMLVGVVYFGMFGVIISPVIAVGITYPLVVYYARKYSTWDPRHDVIYLGLGLAICALALWVNDTAVADLLRSSAGEQ